MPLDLMKHVRRIEYYRRRVKPDFAPLVSKEEEGSNERREWNKYFAYKLD